MKLYAFELGRKKELCFAELRAVLGVKNFVERNLDTVIFKLPEIEAQKLQDKLGGTIKIVEILEKLTVSTKPPDLKTPLENYLKSQFSNNQGKIVFAVSLLSFNDQRSINIKELLNFSKKILKSLGLNSRFVNKNFQNTKPSTIFKARVLEKGIDFNIIKGERDLYLGTTVSIQNIDNYSKRDYDKPCRDAKVGMLPPKLAQIMINLAGADTKTVYDPFCGTGTVLMEAMLMGKSALGSDIDPLMVSYTQENCTWLRHNFYNKNPFRTFERDARFLNKALIPEKVDTIVTEGYLGPLFSKEPTPHEQETNFRELANLHLNWLKAVNPLLEKKGKIVMCVTAYSNKGRLAHLPRFQELAQTAGFKVMETFTYDRPDQIVARDIKILEKN